jgi:hypothetical protein
MKRNLNHEEIEYNGINLNVAFTVSGKYYPATHYEPAEYPEMEIHEIKVTDSDINIYDIFRDTDIEEIHELLQSTSTY